MFLMQALQPREIRFDAGSVDDQQIISEAETIEVKVVNHAAALVAHERVLPLPWRKFGHVVSKSRIKEFLRAGARDEEFAHVGNVENARGFADGVVFIGNAGVLDRHFPAAEIDELRAERLV